MLKTKRPKNESSRYTNNYNSRDSRKGYSDVYKRDYRYDYDNYSSRSSRYDVDFAYDDYLDYAEYDTRQRYVEPIDQPRYSTFRDYSRVDGNIATTKKKKQKMSNRMKALIIVYFAIITIIATLLIINALPAMNTNESNMGSNSANNGNTVTLDASTINNVILADGSIMTLPQGEDFKYEYTINSNWFDDMCDWMGNIGA